MAKTSSTTESPLVKAYANGLHLAPRKMRLVTNAIKKMHVSDALAQLAHMNKKGAPMVMKLVMSAIANAKNNFSLADDHLYIKEITCDQSQTMKRYFPRARGSAFVIRRKLCNVNIVLEEKKKGKAAATRTSFLRKIKSETPAAESVDAKEASNTKPVLKETKRSQVTKTDEQVKMNKVANKRRLFNRKSGE